MGSENEFKIILADDGSDHAFASISLIMDLNLSHKTNLQLIRIMTPLQAAEHTLIEESLGKTELKLIEKGIKTNSELLLGYPAERIIEFSEEIKPDLIVMGAKGLRSTFGILLGGVAQQVSEYACCPVLIVRAPYKNMENVILATDGSESSQSSLEYLCHFPLRKEVNIEVVHVLPPPPLPISVVEPMFMDLTTNEPWQITEEEASKRKKEEIDGQLILDSYCKRITDFGYKANGILKRGDAATEIIELAKTKNNPLIVTGSRGLSQFKSWLLGSVSRKLVHYSNCSVLVVRSR